MNWVSGNEWEVMWSGGRTLAEVGRGPACPSPGLDEGSLTMCTHGMYLCREFSLICE